MCSWSWFDLEYSKELWELLNDYPPASEKIEIKVEMLFDYQLKLGFHLPQKIVLFASIIALQKWWKMLFISS